MHFTKPLKLNTNDSVEIIAPASRCSDEELQQLIQLLESWKLKCLVKKDIFSSDDLLCANTDEIRFQHLANSLSNPEIKAVFCARGGYGSMRLLKKLEDLNSPVNPKIVIGMSDLTSLKLFLHKHWNWPTIHAGISPGKYSHESLAAVRTLLFGERSNIIFSNLQPLNYHARQQHSIESQITGGNLTLVQSGIGTSWQIDAKDKIILLEEIGERGYRVDRMLEHLLQAGIFNEVKAVLFADFIEGDEPNKTCLIPAVLERFAQTANFPVLQLNGVGHASTNFPVPFGTPVQLLLGDQAQLICESPVV